MQNDLEKSYPELIIQIQKTNLGVSRQEGDEL